MKRRLKEVRVSLGVEIGDIAGVTRISPRYLKAIEEGDFSRVPGGIYVRGYIKEYAKCLGVPYHAAIEEYESYLRNESAAVKDSTVHIGARRWGAVILRLIF